MSELHMHKPIWVWCYLTFEDKHHSQRDTMPTLSVWPQAHTYAFETEELALAHPDKVGWHKVHGYMLQKVWLQVPIDTTPSTP